MTPFRPFRLQDLAEACGARLEGDDLSIEGAAGLDEADERSIAFVRDGTPPEQVAASRAGALVVTDDWPALSRPHLRHENPRFVFALALRLLCPPEAPRPGIHPTAVIAASAEIGEDCSIGPYAVVDEGARVGPRAVLGAHVYVGPRCRIGEEARLDPQVVVYRDCEIGDRVTVFAGAVVGCDGFGFEVHGGAVHRLHHIGNTVLEDDVEIGAGTCVDRATTGTTRVGRSSKLDNLVMIGHNCRIGRGTMIAGQTGIAGSTVIGDGVIIGGDVSIRDHVEVGDGARIGGRSAVGSDVPAGASWSGYPARDHKQALRELMAVSRLPELIREVRDLRARLEALERGRGAADGP